VPILCKICGLRPAKIHYTEIVNNSVVNLDLCLECATERGIDVPKGGALEMGDLAAGLIDTLVDSDSEKLGNVHCSFCGYAYSHFKQAGRFGCPDCYDSFRAQVLPLLRQIHGGVHHKGKSPEDGGPGADLKKELQQLKDALSRAIELEEYERAAEVRDRIKELEKQAKEL
jgi:protein arginine kinase activator